MTSAVQPQRKPRAKKTCMPTWPKNRGDGFVTNAPQRNVHVRVTRMRVSRAPHPPQVSGCLTHPRGKPRSSASVGSLLRSPAHHLPWWRAGRTVRGMIAGTKGITVWTGALGLPAYHRASPGNALTQRQIATLPLSASLEPSGGRSQDDEMLTQGDIRRRRSASATWSGSSVASTSTPASRSPS